MTEGNGVIDLDFSRYLSTVVQECRDSTAKYINTLGTVIPLKAELTKRRRMDEREADGAGYPGLERGGQERPVEPPVDVLEGLRDHATGGVLLTGRPGSGKTTALNRLLLESAERAQNDPSRPVPVLIELRGLSGKCDHIQLILSAFSRSYLSISANQLEQLISDERLLLLLDGVNEIPDIELRDGLRAFVQGLPLNTQLVASTRDIELGGDLGIDRRLSMLPLTEPQAVEFVKEYLPERGEPLVHSLRGRFSELQQTPLFLAMLCDFAGGNEGDMPENTGLFFRGYCRWFTEQKHTQSDVRFSAECWRRCLMLLAFAMLDDPERQITLRAPMTLAREAARDALSHAGYEPGLEKELLEELERYHLLELTRFEEAEAVQFTHQLFQEYYAAEQLLKRIRDTENELNDETLKWRYLNKLKWTESLLLLMELLRDHDVKPEVREAVWGRILDRGAELDAALFAKLLGRTSKEMFETNLSRLESLARTREYYVELLSTTRHETAMMRLVELLENDREARWFAASALKSCYTDKSQAALFEFLVGDNTELHQAVIFTLIGRGGSPKTQATLINLLCDEDALIRWAAVSALSRYNTTESESALARMLEDQEEQVRLEAASALCSSNCASISRNALIMLVGLLQAEDRAVCRVAASVLASHDSPDIDELINPLVDDAYELKWSVESALNSGNMSEIQLQIQIELECIEADSFKVMVITLGRVQVNTGLYFIPQDESAMVLTGLKQPRIPVIFIHGLDGSARDWAQFIEIANGDEQLAGRFRFIEFEYDTAVIRNLPRNLSAVLRDFTRLFTRRWNPSLTDIADALRTFIGDEYRAADEVVLVCHSMGGLVARRYIADALLNEGSTLVSRLILYAVPSNGASLARVGLFAAPYHRQLIGLCRDSDLLRGINSQWSDMKILEKVRTTFVCGLADNIVKPIDAQPDWGTGSVDNVPGADHFSIIQPGSAESLQYKLFRNFLLNR